MFPYLMATALVIGILPLPAYTKTVERLAENMLQQIGKTPLKITSDKAIKLALEELKNFVQSHGKELSPKLKGKIHQTARHLKNFDSIRQALAKCQTEKTKELAAQIVDVAGATRTLSIDCVKCQERPFEDLIAFISEATKSTTALEKRVTKDKFFANLYQQSMEDLTKTYILHQYLFNTKLNRKQIKESWKDLCPSKSCPPSLKESLPLIAQNALETIQAQEVSRYPSHEVTIQRILGQKGPEVCLMGHVPSSSKS